MKYFLFILIALIFASLPLFQPGFLPTHDGEYHIIRFFEFGKMLEDGYLFPRWAPGLNSGYGVPLFNFFYPFPNYVGVALHGFGWSLADSFKLSMAVGYITAGIWCFYWLKQLFGAWPAIVGTIIFAFTPYWFVDLYVRGSIGEVFAISFFMLALVGAERKLPTAISLAIAGIVLSHNILAIIFLPLFIFYLIVQKPRYIVQVFIGLGLSAYFWLPALVERPFVQGLNTVNFRDYFPAIYQILIPSWGTGFAGGGITGNEMSPQIGIVSIFIMVIAPFFIWREPKGKIKKLTILFLFLFGASLFLMLGISRPIWEHITVLSYLQYPWRLLSIVPFVSALLCAFLISKVKQTIFGILFIVFAVALSYSYARPAIYEPRSDEYYLSKREFTDGTSSLGNSFSTIWSPHKTERPQKAIEVLSGSAEISYLETKPAFYRFHIASLTQSSIGVNALYYPGWTVSIDEQRVPIQYQQDGIITFTAPKGTHFATVSFTETPIRLLSDFLSLLSLFWIFGSAILKRYYEYRH